MFLPCELYQLLIFIVLRVPFFPLPDIELALNCLSVVFQKISVNIVTVNSAVNTHLIKN